EDRGTRAAAGAAGKPQIYVMPVDGGEARRLTEQPLGAEAPVWSHDSTRLAFLARIPEPGRYGTDDGVGPEKEPPRRIARLFYRVDGVGFRLDRPRHIFVVSVTAADAQP